MAISLSAVLSVTDNMSRPLRSVNRQMDTMRHSTSSLNRYTGHLGATSVNSFNNMSSGASHVTGKIATLAAGVATAVGAAKLLDKTIGEAMRFEQSEVLVTAMFDDKKLSKQYTKMVERLAQDSPIMDTSTMMGSSKAFVGITKDLGSLKKAWNIAEKLSVMDPEQGLQGAVYAMKELSSGDIVSMAERFEMPKKALNAIKGLSFNEQLAGLQAYLDGVGITDKTVAQMGNTTMARFNQISEKAQSFFRKIGTSGNNAIGDALGGILDNLDDKKLATWAQQADQVVGSAITNIIGYVQQIDLNAVKDNVLSVFKAIKTAITFAVDNWSTITTVLKYALAAFIALKAITFLIGVVGSVIRVVQAGVRIFNMLKKAVALVRLSMLLFPGSWIVVAIGSVIAIAITLYKNWDVVKEKTMALWDAFGGLKGILPIILGPIGLIIGAAMDLAKNWDNTKSVWENVWGAILRTAASSVNGVIEVINNLIGYLNKIPGVEIDAIGKVSWGSDAPSTYVSASSGISNGPSAISHSGGISNVPHDDYYARLHKGERVLTKEENDARKGDNNFGGGVMITGNTFHVRQESDIDDIAAKLADLIIGGRT